MVSLRIQKPEPRQTNWVVVHSKVEAWVFHTQIEAFHPFVECDTLREALRPLIKATPKRSSASCPSACFLLVMSWCSLSSIPPHRSNLSKALSSNHLCRWWWWARLSIRSRPEHPQAAIHILTMMGLLIDDWCFCSCLAVIIFHDFTWETTQLRAKWCFWQQCKAPTNRSAVRCVRQLKWYSWSLCLLNDRIYFPLHSRQMQFGISLGSKPHLPLNHSHFSYPLVFFSSQ